MAFWFIYSSEIRNYLCRFHDYLSEKKYTWADDFTDHTHYADNGVYLRQVSAIGAELFPDVWYGIQTNDINPWFARYSILNIISFSTMGLR